MDPIYSMTTLQRNPSVVKEDAKKGLVRITEQGAGAYVFCGEQAFERIIAQAREDAAYEARAIDAAERGAADIEAGRYTTSIDDAFNRARELRGKYA
jgi:PHD/YefM family antitoxin component YafN of YafNO toxin-antitoxin module